VGGLVKPFAFVVAANGAHDDALTAELAALAADRLPAHQRPRRIMLVDELPRTATGKIQRFLLKQRVERG
jgi:benzoate-CoA ligase